MSSDIMMTKFLHFGCQRVYFPNLTSECNERVAGRGLMKWRDPRPDTHKGNEDIEDVWSEKLSGASRSPGIGT